MTAKTAPAHILVGIDGSDNSTRAALWAAREATLRGLPLMLVSVIDFGAYVTGAGYATMIADTDPIDGEVHAHLNAVDRKVKVAFPDVTTRLVVRSGVPTTELRALSAGAHLTVVGATGLGGFSSLLMGTTALAMVTHGHSPVAVVRGDETTHEIPETGPVVLGVDGREFSEAAIAWAFDEASRRDAPLVAVHAWTPYPSPYARAYLAGAGTDWEAEAAEQHEILAERLAGWQEKYPDVVVKRVLHTGPPAQTLLDQAADAQLLVVGSRGHGDVTGLAFGSVSRALIHHANCPVLVARNRT